MPKDKDKYKNPKWDIPEMDDWDDEYQSEEMDDRVTNVGCQPSWSPCQPNKPIGCRPSWAPCWPRPCNPHNNCWPRQCNPRFCWPRQCSPRLCNPRKCMPYVHRPCNPL